MKKNKKHKRRIEITGCIFQCPYFSTTIEELGVITTNNFGFLCKKYKDEYGAYEEIDIEEGQIYPDFCKLEEV